MKVQNAMSIKSPCAVLEHSRHSNFQNKNLMTVAKTFKESKACYSTAE